MSILDLLWVDDDWEPIDSERITHRRQWLERPAEELLARLKDRAVRISRVANAGLAVADLAAPGSDYRLVVIDYQFLEMRHNWRDLLHQLQVRGIPYILYSALVHQASQDPTFPSRDPLSLGRFDKTEEGRSAFVERVAQFFLALPIRLLHLTDLHYDSGLREDEASDRTQMYEALFSTLRNQKLTRPVDGVVLTGDLAAKDPPQDLMAIREPITQLIESTIGAPNITRLLLIPGNHDLHWSNFQQRHLADRPWQPYLEFYQWLYSTYGGRPELLAEMAAWNPSRKLFRYPTTRHDLTWNRRLGDLLLNIIGLASPVDDAMERQGLGGLGQQQHRFIRSAWQTGRPYGEVRLALSHHNLFGVLSRSRKDDKDVVQDPGEFMYELMRGDCSVLLTGHTHTPYMFSCEGWPFSGDAVKRAGRLTAVSAGTMGGLHAGGDRRRSFNIVELSDALPTSGTRRLSLRTFLYISEAHEWSEATGPADLPEM